MTLEPFSAILSDYTSKYNKIKKENYLPEGQFPIIDQGQKFVGGYTDDGGLITDIEKELIIFGDHTKILKFIDFPIAIGADGVKVLHVNKEKADPRYVYYFLKSVKLTDAGYSRHFKFLKELKIPIPEDINDQIKIARLLNHVETLIVQREESIRLLDKLLESKFFEMFGETVNNLKNWEKVPLSKFGTIITGNTPSRSDSQNYSEDFIEWIKTDNIIEENIIITRSKEYLSEQGLKKSRFINKGALLVACIAGSIDSVGRASLTDRKVSFNQQINALQPNDTVNPYYLYWLFKNSKRYVQNHATKGMKKILTKGLFEKILMIKPPIELQNQFAEIVKKIELLKIKHLDSLKELENMNGVLTQKAFNTEFILNQENDEVKKKSEEVMEQDDLEQYSKSIDLKKDKVDITNMSFDEYYEIPGEVTFKNEKWITYFLHDDLLYQFLLKDNFKDVSFTLGDIEMQLHNFFYHTCDMDFDNEKWKQIIFNFLEANPPLIEQYFDKESATIKLKLTDEAFKA